jgi:hypothetical protein
VRAVVENRVLLVTDVVLEAPAPDGTEFGEAGVQRVLDRADTADRRSRWPWNSATT